MPAEPSLRPSFTPFRKWRIGFNVVLIILLVFSVVVMVNYLSRDYFLRFHVSDRGRAPLSPRTTLLLAALTNQVRVTIYFDRTDALYTTIADLLNEYHLANSKVAVQTVDYVRDPGAAQQLKLKYPVLASAGARNFVIFDSGGRVKPVDGMALAQYALERVPNEKEPEFRRKPTAFLGEILFTAALLDVTSPRPLNACFLKGHGEHQFDSGDADVGYLKFAAVLAQNNIHVAPLTLLGTNTVPMDCNLLIIAGPTAPIPELELEKIEKYLAQGGRLLALFNFMSVKRDTGLEEILARWGVQVSTNIVKDPENTISGSDVIVSSFSKHPIVNPLLQSSLHLMMPRMVAKLAPRADPAEAPRVETLASSGPKSFLSNRAGTEPGSFPVMAAVEKGALKDVITERGTTRMVICGDSLFLGNRLIDSAANRDFASYAVNWLLDRTQLLQGLGPRPIAEYKLVMTKTQLQRAEWVLLGGLPGAALLLGSLVWLRRRR